MALINQPLSNAVDRLEIDNDGTPTLAGVSDGWRNFFNSVFTICNALTTSGTTANRPTKGLWVGRMYFDTSLGAHGKPIWVDKAGTGWVLADGTVA